MREAIREAVTSYLDPIYKVQFPDIPLVWKNAPFDWNDPPPVFTYVEIVFHHGAPIGMRAAPKMRLQGHIYVYLYVKEGDGTKTALETLDWVESQLKFRKIGLAQCQEPSPSPIKGPTGWEIEATKVVFFADEP